MTYAHTLLWKQAFGERPDDIHKEQRELLRVAYIALRKRAEALVADISSDLRQYTIHDITHLDALWGVASEIVGPDFVITPTEAFILGASFLLHDAGMCVAAYPGGLEEIKSHRLWSTTLRKFAKNFEAPTQSEISVTVQDLLRAEHANRAQDLLNTEWRSPIGSRYFLIDDVDLRQKFANAVGEISASHWWSHDKLAANLDRILPAPPPFPTEWRADLLKLASILRVSDAAHIDERRAPGFIWALRNSALGEASNVHWLFQNRLTQPERRDDALHYSSTSDFNPSEAEAWWLANDTLRMINRELNSTDVLLADLRGADLRLAARRVANVESTATMVNSLRVRDWIPIDTNIKISDVPHLIRSLGGRALYGTNKKVPLRELLQNAADAIRLKAEVLPNFPLGLGRIEVHVGKDEQGVFLQVTDNGIGMTREIISGPFLDFGNSGWSSDPVFLDYAATDPQKLGMIGKFGIGFFSTFMLGDRVQVVTRRFDRAFQDTLVLTFSGGVGRRPILRQALNSEWLTEGGTSVKVWIKDASDSLDNLFGKSSRESLPNVCEQQFPLSEIAIHTTVLGQTKVISSVDWNEMSAEKLLKRINATSDLPDFIKPFLNNIRPIYDSAKHVIGRAFVAPTSFDAHIGEYFQEFYCNGVVTSRGMFVCDMDGIYGVIEGDVEAANRFSARPKPTREEFHRWLNEQSALLSIMSMPPKYQLSCASVIYRLGGETNGLGICQSGAVTMSTGQLREFLSVHRDLTIVQSYQTENIAEVNPRARLLESVVTVPMNVNTIFSKHVRAEYEYERYLKGEDDLETYLRDDLANLVLRLAGECWNLDEKVICALRVGSFNDKPLSSKIVIARTERNEEIKGFGTYLFKGMTVNDLKFAAEA